MSTSLRDEFLLDPNIVFLNHGSFGACPAPVFAEYQRWQRELEYHPVEFLGRRATDLLAVSRAALANYVGADPEEIVYFPNPTTAANMVIHNLRLQAGDEVLTTDHEYGALDRAWRVKCKQTGATYNRRPIALPQTTHANFVEHFWGGVTPRTRVIFVSHLTSATALIFPVQEIVRRARAQGILTIVDGAHVPGQLPLDLHALGCDVYTGACHKWLCGPKGAAFLYARPAIQEWLNPLIVSWGWGDESIDPSPNMGDTQFIRFHQWQGTRDLAAFLTVPTAIEFQHDHHWDEVRKTCHALASATRDRLNALTGLASLTPELNGSEEAVNGSPYWFAQLVAVQLPNSLDLPTLKTRLYDEFHIEIPVHQFNDLKLMRMSFQGYNTQADADALVNALKVCLQGHLS
jgi:isopenicillin-N epimerase